MQSPRFKESFSSRKVAAYSKVSTDRGDSGGGDSPLRIGMHLNMCLLRQARY
jgi:hypothetical protein